MVNDQVSDLLTRIRNASLRQATTVQVPATRFGRAIVEALVRTGYLASVESRELDGRPMLEIAFRYVNGLNTIQALKQLSTQGLRRYTSYKTLRTPRHGGGMYLLSTPVGVLSDREARAKGVGGELICEIHS